MSSQTDQMQMNDQTGLTDHCLRSHVRGKGDRMKFDHKTQKPIDSSFGIRHINGRNITTITQTVQCKICLEDVVLKAGNCSAATLNSHKGKCKGPPKGPEHSNDVDTFAAGGKRLYSSISQGLDLSFWAGAGDERDDSADGDDEASLGGMDSGDSDNDGMEMKFYSEVPGVLRSACQESEDDGGYMQFGFEQENDREDMQGDDKEDSQSEDEQEIPFIPPLPPCKRLIEYQQRILDYFNKDLYIDGKGPLTFNDRKKSRGGGEILAEDVIDLNLMRQVNVLSAKQADGVLKTFETIIDRHNAHVPLPSSFREIDRRVFEDMKTVRQIKEFKYSYPASFFGAELKDLRGKPLKLAAVGVCFDFCETIGHHLLNLKDNKNFISEPHIQMRNGVRIYEDYTTGKHFQLVTLALRKRTQNKDAIVLAIGFTLDAAKLGKSTGSMCPLLVYIPNLINQDYKMLFLGYVPIKLSYSKKVLVKLLQNQGCTSVARCEEIIQMLLRKIKLNFIYDALQQIIPLGNTGMDIMLRDEKGAKEILLVHPKLSLITGDNEELHKLAGQSIKAKSSKNGRNKKICRICTSGDCIRDLDWGDQDPVIRSDRKMETLGKLGEELMYKTFAGGYILTAEDKLILKALVEWNVKPGFNPLYQFFYGQVSDKVLSFHLALVPDILHTVLKGLAEYAIHWSWDCISCLQKLDLAFFDNIVAFDERMTKFPYIQSFRFFPNCRFRVGVSNFMKGSTKSNSGTSFASGGIEAWKLQNLLLQMLFCIDGKIAPFTHQWSIDKRLKYSWNVGRTLVNALTSALEVIFVVKAAKLAENNLQSLQTMIATSRAHIMLLWCMRKDLLAAVTTKKIARKKGTSRGPIDLKSMEQDFFSGIKLHLLMHFVFYKQFYGADRRIIDTELSELFHKYVVNEVFETTSKNAVSVAKEMITSIQKRFHSLDLHSMISKVKRCNPPVIVDGTTEVLNEEGVDDSKEDKDTHDEDPYRIINNFGKEHLEFQGERTKELKVVLEWTCYKDGQLHRRHKKTEDALAKSKSNAVHPMVSLAFFSKILLTTELTGAGDMMTTISNKSEPNLQITLLKGLRLTAIKEHGGDGKLFYIHADASYVSDKKCDLRKENTSVFSFVQVRLEDGLAYGQVVAIVGVRDLSIVSSTKTQKNANSKYARVMVCIAYLQPVTDNTYIRDGLPFPRYEYEYVHNDVSNRRTDEVWTQLFDATDVVLPAFMIGSNPNKWGNIQDAKYCKEAVYYCLPYERAVVPVTAALTDALEGAEDEDEQVILHGGEGGGIAEVLEQLNERLSEEDIGHTEDIEKDDTDDIEKDDTNPIEEDGNITDGDILGSSSSESDFN